MARTSRDVVGFRRIFVLFITLVLLPALFMSGFAIVAISNERAAQKQRTREAAERVQVRAEAAFASLVDDTDRRVRDAFYGVTRREQLHAAAARARGEGAPVGAWAVVVDGAVVAGEPPFLIEAEGGGHLPDTVRAVLDDIKGLAATHISLDADPSGVVSMQRLQDATLAAYLLDEDALVRAYEARADLGSRFTARLRRPAEFGGRDVTSLDRFMAEVMRAAESAADSDAANSETGEVVLETRLAEPFARFSLVLVAEPEGPANTIVYVVLLLVFMSTLITGVVITSRLIWTETRLSRLKTDFVSHMSHELRTPLTSIRMFIETLQRGRASQEEQEECLDLLTRETERLSDMIERVLGYARLRAGRRLFNVETLDVSALIDDAIESFRAQHLSAGSAPLELTLDVDDNLPFVLADWEAMIEALLNLLGNAYKYTGGDKRVGVFAKEARRRVLIGVEDNGPGLPKADQARVFERFYQAGSLLSEKKPGSGLGLAITRGIVEGQGGRISVQSEVGKGTTFLVELRIAS